MPAIPGPAADKPVWTATTLDMSTGAGGEDVVVHAASDSNGPVPDPQVALVQSPQEFCNDSSFEHTALRGDGVFADQEMFSSISR